MRLLFDQNLSRHLVSRLADEFPDSQHVSALDLSEVSDLDVWVAARDGGYTIVTKDSDFNNLLVLRGHPPHVVWIQRGNCSTADIEGLLRSERSEIEDLSESGDGLLVVQ